jgi:hypothetical protein
VDSSDVDAYMQSLINSHNAKLPPLANDSSGRLNTIFMVHFAPNVAVTDSGSTSCVDFVGTFDNVVVGTDPNTTIVPIGLIPDCSQEFPITVASSGILASIVTDPQIDSNPAWFSNEAGEDIFYLCNTTDDYEANVTVNGHNYEVATLWSNNSNRCISAERIFASGFEAPSS